MVRSRLACIYTFSYLLLALGSGVTMQSQVEKYVFEC